MHLLGLSKGLKRAQGTEGGWGRAFQVEGTVSAKALGDGTGLVAQRTERPRGLAQIGAKALLVLARFFYLLFPYFTETFSTECHFHNQKQNSKKGSRVVARLLELVPVSCPDPSPVTAPAL